MASVDPQTDITEAGMAIRRSDPKSARYLDLIRVDSCAFEVQKNQ